jgi:hypothetical protein
MGASASTQLPPFETVEAALTAGKTQDEIDAWHVSQEGGELTMTTSRNGHDEFLNHSSNSETLQRMREEEPHEEMNEDETSSSSSLAQTTTHQDEAATLQTLVVTISLLSIIPTDTLFLIMEFLDCVGLSRLMSVSSSMQRVVNIFLERLSKQESFAVTASGPRCLKNTMKLLRMLSKRGNGYDMARRTVSLVMAEGVHDFR